MHWYCVIASHFLSIQPCPKWMGHLMSSVYTLSFLSSFGTFGLEFICFDRLATARGWSELSNPGIPFRSNCVTKMLVTSSVVSVFMFISQGLEWAGILWPDVRFYWDSLSLIQWQEIYDRYRHCLIISILFIHICIQYFLYRSIDFSSYFNHEFANYFQELLCF